MIWPVHPVVQTLLIVRRFVIWKRGRFEILLVVADEDDDFQL
jgi:hypothetical protein